jgi:hypothetical protein
MLHGLRKAYQKRASSLFQDLPGELMGQRIKLFLSLAKTISRRRYAGQA